MSDQAKSTNKRQRGLSRLAFWTARSQNSPQFPPALGPLLQALEKNHPKADPDIVLRAYRVAEKWHRGQTRKSGDPYITHPVAVATILAEIGMTPVTLAAALLHDTVEDTGYSLEDLRTDFGDEIALMVDGVTKLDKIQYGAAAQSETVRKMIVAMSQDIRVLVIKLADRLHNARTWKYVPASSSERKARETLEIFAPLAHRLGMNTIKWELEDLSFQVLLSRRSTTRSSDWSPTGPRTREVPRASCRANSSVLHGVQHRCDDHRTAEALLFDLSEDGGARTRIRRHLRPRRRARPGLESVQRVLRDPRHRPRPLEPGSGPVQGLHRDAEVQHVPEPAHDGDRTQRQTRRDPDPHP
jgi:hypothetical protein